MKSELITLVVLVATIAALLYMLRWSASYWEAELQEAMSFAADRLQSVQRDHRKQIDIINARHKAEIDAARKLFVEAKKTWSSANEELRERIKVAMAILADCDDADDSTITPTSTPDRPTPPAHSRE